MARPRKMTEEKRLNVKLEADRHEQFRIACELQGTSMSDAVSDFIARYIRLYGPDQDLAKGRKHKVDDGPNM